MVVQLVKALVAKLDDLSSIPYIYIYTKQKEKLTPASCPLTATCRS